MMMPNSNGGWVEYKDYLKLLEVLDDALDIIERDQKTIDKTIEKIRTVRLFQTHESAPLDTNEKLFIVYTHGSG